MKFRIRRAYNGNDWVIADADETKNTYEYVQCNGTTSGACYWYDIKAEAQAAFDLYLEKQKSTTVTLAKDPEYYGQLASGKQKPQAAVPNKHYGHPRFYKILKQMEELHSRKNHDYAGTSDPLKNLRACERLELKPFMGVMVRLQDKWSRLEEFVKSGQLMVKNESVIDTLMDNAVYSVLAIVLYEEQLKEELDSNAAVDHETGAGRTKPVPGGY